jgi:hypothetical protein
VVSSVVLEEEVEEGGASTELLTVAIPGGGPRIPVPAVCENLTYFCRLFFRFAVEAAGRGGMMRGGRQPGEEEQKGVRGRGI